MTWLPYSSEQMKDFAGLASLYGQAREIFRELAYTQQWIAAPGSAAASDREALAGRGLMSGTELLIPALCHDYMYAASEQLGALSALYRASEVLLAPNVVARCAVEHLAHVAWIIGAPTDGVEDRHARALLEELAGAEQEKTTAGHLLGRSNAEYQARLDRWRRVMAEAKRACPDFSNDSVTGNAVMRGVTLPRPEHIVTAMYGFLTPPLPSKQREGIYDFLSNHVHPTPYTSRELFRSQRGENGELSPELAVDPEFHGKLARLVMTPFHLVIAMLLSYNSWPDAHLKQLEAAIDIALPGTLVGVRQI